MPPPPPPPPPPPYGNTSAPAKHLPPWCNTFLQVCLQYDSILEAFVTKQYQPAGITSINPFFGPVSNPYNTTMHTGGGAVSALFIAIQCSFRRAIMRPTTTLDDREHFQHLQAAAAALRPLWLRVLPQQAFALTQAGAVASLAP